MDRLNDEFLESLKLVGIYDEEFLSFLDGKVHRYPSYMEQIGWAVFPKLDKEGKIIDIRMLVPIISDEKTLLINIHEYVHAYDLYKKLNEFDDTRKDEEFENRAKNAERLVLEKKKKI